MIDACGSWNNLQNKYLRCKQKVDVVIFNIFMTSDKLITPALSDCWTLTWLDNVFFAGTEIQL